MDDYLCVTLRSRADEKESDFQSRLSTFWTHMLRNRPDDYERIYAEATKFGAHDGMATRQYLIEAGVSELLQAELRTASIEFEPIDEDDIYSKYEAAPPDWFWIEH